MEAEASTTEARDLDVWLRQDLVLATTDRDKVAALVRQALEDVEYREVEQSTASHAIEICGRFGTKLRAFLMGLLPFGKHIPWGKRLHARATIRSDGGQTQVSLQVTPWMELFDESEALLVSQSPDEKASDEYLAALQLRKISAALRRETNTPEPDRSTDLKPKTFAADFVTGLLLYALEGDSTKKLVHLPAEPKFSWTWGAFIIPELWFVWHEIWGVSLLMVGLDWALFKLLTIWPTAIMLGISAAFFAGFRVMTGLQAQSIFYARYGRWPQEPAD
jgi:hypothetical protein